jgi:transposase
MSRTAPLPIERTIGRLADLYERLHVCFEAGPTGYGLYRQIQALGHDCMVVAPALIPKRPGERMKTNRRDAVTLARLHRAGELTGVWTPDAAHDVNRLQSLTPSFSDNSTSCRADRRSDPTPNDSPFTRT